VTVGVVLHQRKPVEREKVDLPVLEIPQAAEKKRKRDDDSDDDDDDSDNDAAAKKKKQQLESGVQKFKVKGKSAVHPDSGLDDDGHIYQSDSGTVYNVMLNLAGVYTRIARACVCGDAVVPVCAVRVSTDLTRHGAVRGRQISRRA
jgi:hypothetical protein